MNLKTAARRLGVHYQTAYRYVRSGDLVAVRVGSGYEISESALELARTRLAIHRIVDHPVAAMPPATLAVADADADAALDDLDVLVDACTLSAQPVLDEVVRRLSREVGDVAAVLLRSADGQWLQAVASADRDPARLAMFAAIHAVAPIRVASQPNPHSALAGRTHVVHHLRTADALELLPPQFRGNSAMIVQGYVSVPIARRDGHIDGVVVVMRFAGGVPYSPEHVLEVERLTGRVADALEHVQRYTAAWLARDNLRQSLEQLARVGGARLDDVSDALVGLLDDEIPEAVFAPDRTLVAANDPFMEFTGEAPESPALGVCGCDDGVATWGTLLSGAADYLSTRPSACVLGARTLPWVQWAIIRRPDATPFAVLAVLEPTDTPTETGATGPTTPASSTTAPVSICWGPCS